jgi:hypothetical protein
MKDDDDDDDDVLYRKWRSAKYRMAVKDFSLNCVYIFKLILIYYMHFHH